MLWHLPEFGLQPGLETVVDPIADLPDETSLLLDAAVQELVSPDQLLPLQLLDR